MARLILSMMMTVDGFVAGPGNELDWVIWEEEMDRDAATLIGSVATMLVGYGAYADMAAYWPAALTNPGSQSEGEFSRLINEKPKIVISRSPRKPLWKNETMLVVDDLQKQIADLKQRNGDLVFYGGAGLAPAMVAAGVVDEYRLLVSPTAIGQGRPLFSTLPARLGLNATVTKVYASGAVLLNYHAGAQPG